MKYVIILVSLLMSQYAFGQDHEPRDGKTIYTGTCLMCHGDLGDKGLAGAKNLITSTLSDSLSTAIIRDGKNAMMAYGSMLSEAELKNIVEYIKTLRAKVE